MLWLGVHFPDLGLEIFATEQTAAAQRPQVLVEDNRVLLRNAAAVAAGIAPGASLATAHSIAPELVHHHRDTGKEQARLQLLVDRLEEYLRLAGPGASARPAAGSRADADEGPASTAEKTEPAE